MNRVWQIARKDLSRAGIPAGLWLAFIVGTTGWLSHLSPGRYDTGLAGLAGWLETVSIWSKLQIAGAAIIGMLLSGSVVLEDTLTGSTSFWMTRPISPGRLLAAKSVATTLLFIAAPTLALIPVWLSIGFTGRDLLLASLEFALWQTGITVVAVTLASVAGSLAQFIFYAVGFGIAGMGCVILTLLVSRDSIRSLSKIEALFSVGAVVVGCGVAFMHQNLQRRTGRTFAILGSTLVVGMLLQLGWRKLPSDGAGQFRETPEDRAAKIEVSRSLETFSRNERELPFMRVSTEWFQDRLYVPVVGRRADGRVLFRGINDGGRGGYLAGLRALGSRGGDAPFWQLMLEHPPRENLADSASLHYSGELEIWSARVKVMGEFPLHVGGELSRGSTTTRILELQRTGEQLDGIFIEEREPSFSLVGGATEVVPRNAFLSRDYFDRYYLRDRTDGTTVSLSASDVSTVAMNSVRVTVRRLFVPGSVSGHDASVVKVRIERDHSFTRPFDVQGITSRSRGNSP